jgi:hypothetical protein
MPQPTAKEIVAALDELEAFLNDSKYIPATNVHRSKVLLALPSKALTTARAVCTLVEAGFNGEAFGLSRTLIEIYLTIRYITNKDTEARAKEYVEYVAKTQEYLMGVAAKHFPQRVLPPMDDEFKEMAKKYRSPHSWFQAHGGHVRALATEPDAHEVDAQGNPIVTAPRALIDHNPFPNGGQSREESLPLFFRRFVFGCQKPFQSESGTVLSPVEWRLN